MRLFEVIGRGLDADKPVSPDIGEVYFVTDVGGGKLQRWSGDTWEDIEGTGTGDPADVMLRSVYDTDGNNAVDEADHAAAADTVPWSGVSSTPADYPPSDHDHDWEDLTDPPATMPPDAHTHPWTEITDKPDLDYPELLDELDDVEASSPADGQQLAWSDALGVWRPVDAGSGASSSGVCLLSGSTRTFYAASVSGLASAIAAAVSGDRIIVPAGIYVGTWVIPVSVEMIGESCAGSLLYGQVTASDGARLRSMGVLNLESTSPLLGVVVPSGAKVEIHDCFVCVSNDSDGVGLSRDASATAYVTNSDFRMCDVPFAETGA